MADEHTHDHGSDLPIVADASVRLARVSDAPAVGVVQAALWTGAYAAHVPPEVLAGFQPPAFASVWRESLTHPPTRSHRLLVGCAGEQVVAMAAVGPSDDPDRAEGDAEVLVLGVHPGARRQGHGSRLLHAVVDTVRGSGASVLRVWVPEGDRALLQFLEAAGFGSDGAVRDREVGPGHVLRELRLSSAVTDPSEDGRD
ncbi:MAG: GNAT family N-acetyltransferase [Actinomycetota bacterium]|nr:GNAT family N-acetyltransferase [Actinomycetota bacterium]